MNAGHIFSERRRYNQWVNSQTMEDYALRYTATGARRWSTRRITQTAIGASSFLACEAIGGTITLTFGFPNAIAAICASMALMFLIGLPIAYHAAREGLDIDLLTRGAGFGYLGSTITSLIYASFTFLLFAIEASIMASAIELATGLPIAWAYLVSAMVVLPVALYGMRAITRMQVLTQPLWLALQFGPLAYVLIRSHGALSAWTHFTGQLGARDGSVDLLLFGMAFSTILSLLPQIGEQADYLRFLPGAKPGRRGRWWAAVLAGGPGWTFLGGLKIATGSFLALFALRHGAAIASAGGPPAMFAILYREMTGSWASALALTLLFVVVCQMKINVTNAYAGSIAWSNFFSRLTHAHPGRVVWLVFNVLLAVLLMEVGAVRAAATVLALYANLAAGWIGALSADLVISKPLGLSPHGIEFRRAYLYDINPVGVGAMALSFIVSTCALLGLMGVLVCAFAPVLGLAVAFVMAPTIALATRGRFYIARAPDDAPQAGAPERCIICEMDYEAPDMACCPMHHGRICSLCCTLEARCHDMCKTNSSLAEQATQLINYILPRRIAISVHTSIGHFVAVMLAFTATLGLVLYLIRVGSTPRDTDAAIAVSGALWAVFVVLVILAGIVAWLFVLAHDSRRAAEQESRHQTDMLQEEIAAHTRTDTELQRAKEAAESANAAKTRYLVAVSHEIRSPLNAIYGYAQLLERDGAISTVEAGAVIRRSSEHLTNLVEGLLEISRIESGVLKLRSDIVPLPALLDHVVDMFRMQAAAKGLTLTYIVEGRLPRFVRTDEKRLRQILINLLSNAIKYTREGGATLSISYRSQVAEVDVVDTGIGIAPEDMERIFEPFERGSSPEANLQPGIGLGLAITRVLARILGGEIFASSTPGAGSRFRLRILLPEPMTAPAGAAEYSRVIGYDGPRKTVLVIDDDSSQTTVLHSLLKPLGFQVYTSSNGTEGMMVADRCAPDIVLLDIQMPGLSGWDVAARLRATHGAALSIVMVSANAHEFRAGGDGHSSHDAFVSKPVDLRALLDVIGRQLRLDWRIAGDPPVAAVDIIAPLPDSAALFVEELRRLVKVGHVRAIEATLAELEAGVPASAPTVAAMRDHVRNFDLRSLMKMLDDIQAR
ncbi:MAG TPA: ATP-binding protein [Sphingomonas sp.]